MEMAGRGFSGSYRFGYQGSEKDNEVSGDGNSYTTEFRQLDPRLGRWFSVDPVFQPWQSPYTSMDNDPINLNDPMGDKAGKDDKLVDSWINEATGEQYELYQSQDGKYFVDIYSPNAIYTGTINNVSYDGKNWSANGNTAQYEPEPNFTVENRPQGDPNHTGPTSAGRYQGQPSTQNVNRCGGCTGMSSTVQMTWKWHSGNEFFQRGWYTPETFDYVALDYGHGQVLPPMGSAEYFFLMQTSGGVGRYVVLSDYGTMLHVAGVNQQGYLDGSLFVIPEPLIEALIALPVEILMGYAELKGVSALANVRKILKMRSIYEGEVRNLANVAAEMKKAGSTSEEIARTVHKMRRDLGIKYKDMTPVSLRKQIYARNLRDYGDELGPTIDYLRNTKGYSWERIIESSSKPGGSNIFGNWTY